MLGHGALRRLGLSAPAVLARPQTSAERRQGTQHGRHGRLLTLSLPRPGPPAANLRAHYRADALWYDLLRERTVLRHALRKNHADGRRTVCDRVQRELR